MSTPRNFDLSREESNNNPIINSINITSKNNNQDSNIFIKPKDLEYYNKLYKYKKNLEKRDIVFYLSDNDLIDIHNDKSEILYLKIVKGSNETEKQKTVIPPLTPKMDNIKRSSRQNSPKPKSPKHKRSYSKSYDESREIRDMIDLLKIQQLTMMINNISCTINYTDSYETFKLFKIESVNGVISCYGMDNKSIQVAELLIKDYEVKEIEYNNIKYECISPEFDLFVSPMYIECITPKIAHSVADFVVIFSHLKHIFNKKLNSH